MSDKPLEPSLVMLDPRHLIQAKRLDIIVKARYFEALLQGRFVEPAEHLYRKHILARTGGTEPADFHGPVSDKRHIDDYVSACHALLKSMQINGYDVSYPVPLGNSNIPLNGAHRIACATVLGLKVHAESFSGEAGYHWDMAWFVQHGFSKVERLRILFDLVRLVPDQCSVFVFWPHAIDAWNDLTQSIRDHGYDMAGYVDLAWSESERPVYESLIYDLYSFGVTDFVNGFTAIDRKIGFLKEKPCYLRVGVCMQRQAGPSVFPGVYDLKALMRQSLASHVPVDQFVTCHFADTPGETLHMASTLLLPENLQSARLRQVAKPRVEFLQWLTLYRNVLHGQKIAIEDCCIVGSASLEVHGLRQSTDIDFTTRSAIRADHFGPGVTHFEGGVDLVTEGYHKSEQGEHWRDDVLIDQPGLHVYFRGFKMADIAVIRDRKQFSKRPKDLLDVELINRLTEGTD